MSKWTPGPYLINRDTVNGAWRLIGADGYGTIAHIFRHENAVHIAQALRDLDRAKAVNAQLVEALTDAEFLLRKLSINWKEAGAMTDSMKRSAEQARAALSRAQEG